MNSNPQDLGTHGSPGNSGAGGLHHPPPRPPRELGVTSKCVPPPLPPAPENLPTPPALDAISDKQQEVKVFGLSLAIMCGAILLVALSVDFTKLGAPSICTFYRMTGLPCSGCGLSRGCCAIAQGRWEEAWQFNPFSFVFMPLFIVGFVGGALTTWKPSLRPWVLPRGAFIMRLAIILAITMSVFGVWRVYSLVGWAGLNNRVRHYGSGIPPVVLLHGDATIARPPPEPSTNR